MRLGQKVYDYRKDLLECEDAEIFNLANDELKEALSEKPIWTILEEKAKAFDDTTAKVRRFYYHKKSWVENMEMLLVAAIVVIGIRSFFVQPFIIPTNSMYPSFSGMQPHVYETKESTPGFFGRCMDKLLLGASHYKLKQNHQVNLYLKLQGQMSFRFDDAKVS